MSYLLFIRTAAFSMGLILVFFAALQLNDVDPEFWVLLYSLCALVPFMISFNHYSERLFWLCMGLCLAALTLTAHGTFTYLVHFAGRESLIQGMSSDKPYIEETREFIGTIIALVIVFASERLRTSKTG